MIKFILFFIAINGCLPASAQMAKIDSLQAILRKKTNDTNQILTLARLSQAYQDYKPDTALLLAEQALWRAKEIRFIPGQVLAMNEIGIAFSKIGNYPKSLEYYLAALRIEEGRNIPRKLAVAYLNIATLHVHQEEYRKALNYALKAKQIIEANSIRDLDLLNSLNLGDMYEKSRDMDSALFFTTHAFQLATLSADQNIMGCALNNLGNIHSRMGHTELALSHYRAALPLLRATRDEDFICETAIGLAKLFYKAGNPDSALVYARLSYELSAKDQFVSRNLEASKFLAAYFKSTGQFDSAFYYQEQMLGATNELHSREKIVASQVMSMDEQLRQKELSISKAREKVERQKRLQLLGIGCMIPMFFFVTILLSRRKIRPKIIEYSGIISLLLLFEYLTLLMHPFVAEQVHHIPIYEMLVFVTVAAILTPAHHRIEHWLIKRLTYKRSPSRIHNPEELPVS